VNLNGFIKVTKKLRNTLIQIIKLSAFIHLYATYSIFRYLT